MAEFKTAILIDGGFLRVIAKKAKKTYDPDFIEKFAHLCKSADESIFRVLYYDCAPYSGTLNSPFRGTLIRLFRMMHGSKRFPTKIFLQFDVAF